MEQVKINYFPGKWKKERHKVGKYICVIYFEMGALLRNNKSSQGKGKFMSNAKSHFILE